MNLAFRVHIAKNIGLGHFKRLDILKKKLKQNVTWIVSGDKKIESVKEMLADSMDKSIRCLLQESNASCFSAQAMGERCW